MARKRSASSSYEDDSDSDRRLASAQRKRKAVKQQQPQKKRPVHHVAVRSKASRSSSSSKTTSAPPSRVTPEQIIAHAVAMKNQKKKEQQQQALIEQSAGVYEVDAEELVVKQESSTQRKAPVKDEQAATAASDEYDEEEYDDDDDGDEEEEIAAPVVFQCGTCRSIFGDSYSFVGSNADLLLVTLSAVTNITTSAEPQTSKEGMDMGSSFQELLCSQCQTVLGRKYLTTSVPLDAIRGLFSFATTTIASYQLGYPQLQLQSSLANSNGDDASLKASASVSASFEEMKRATITCDQAVKALSGDRQELLKLREDMTKVQNLLLVVDERLHQLEEPDFDSEAEVADDTKQR
ncbi:Kinetochore protein mis18 [Globisporangium polare]